MVPLKPRGFWLWILVKSTDEKEWEEEEVSGHYSSLQLCTIQNSHKCTCRLFLTNDTHFECPNSKFLLAPPGTSWQVVPQLAIWVDQCPIIISGQRGLWLLIMTLPVMNNPEFPWTPSGSSWQSIPTCWNEHPVLNPSYKMSFHHLKIISDKWQRL